MRESKINIFLLCKKVESINNIISINDFDVRVFLLYIYASKREIIHNIILKEKYTIIDKAPLLSFPFVFLLI